jgi:Sensors of blue-light using FAD
VGMGSGFIDGSESGSACVSATAARTYMGLESSLHRQGQPPIRREADGADDRAAYRQPWTMLDRPPNTSRRALPAPAEAHSMSAPHHSPGDEPGFGLALPALYNLVYCSRATAGVGDADVERIIATARRCNAEHGITGMLVFGSGIFFQWLEGPRDNVTALMSLLRGDRRHDNIILLSQTEEVRERLFPDWDMERVTGDHIREVLQDAKDSASDPKQVQALAHLLAELDSGQLSGLNAA